MNTPRLSRLDLHADLVAHAAEMQNPDKHLSRLIAMPDRFGAFSRTGAGLFFDYSRQRLEQRTLDLLLRAAAQLGLRKRFERMCLADKINVTENRAVLHTAARASESERILLDGQDVVHELSQVRKAIETFTDQVHDGTLTGSTAKPFRHVVVVGIGGSYLGTEFAATALASGSTPKLRLHYLSNVDIHNFGDIIAEIDPETTLWVVISKSYTTAETLANVRQAEQFMRANGLDPSRHTVTVTAKGSPGDDPDHSVLGTFYMYDFIGGRYSVTSAVGGVPLSLCFGYDSYAQLLDGAAQMDRHAHQAVDADNLPLLAALISVWNTTYLGYQQHAIVPYAAPLRKLSPHVQQLNMESNGKAVDLDGTLLPEPAGTVIFGEPGTNAQHSFFQSAHQGQPFPIDFIGVRHPHYQQYSSRSRGVTNHQELWVNMIAQARALAVGQSSNDKARHFSGNRPSSCIVLDDLSPVNIGRLLAFYEACTVYEGFLWGINSFDQFGVQLGKSLASGLRDQVARRNQNPSHRFEGIDDISAAYLEMMFKA
jgi:glucose-6-phosphate isomerase